MRIAVLLRDRCQFKKCNQECLRYCPKVRTGVETVIIGGRPARGLRGAVRGLRHLRA